MTIESTTRVRTIAAEHPLATRVFHRHGIDFCCGGAVSLADVCADRGLDLECVLHELDKELRENTEPVERWDLAPIPDLIEHILTTYHGPLREELPRLDAMARKVNKVHGSKASETLGSIEAMLGELRTELESHMAKEEQILFPMILEGNGAMANGPVAVMEEEHRSAADALRRLRQLCGNYQVPEGACQTWRALWHGLAALEQDLHEHIHLENNILFPRALAESP